MLYLSNQTAFHDGTFLLHHNQTVMENQLFDQNIPLCGHPASSAGSMGFLFVITDVFHQNGASQADYPLPCQPFFSFNVTKSSHFLHIQKVDIRS